MRKNSRKSPESDSPESRQAQGKSEASSGQVQGKSEEISDKFRASLESSAWSHENDIGGDVGAPCIDALVEWEGKAPTPAR